ncbi:MAG: rRNA maturation RNase YbeY [Bacteroidaceae bacterium]|nr:rRNA maturation RNase YbeY [Bacteroidaceae bacterium]
MITFQTINVELPEIDQEGVRQWIATVAASYNRGVGDINYIFVDDDEILRVNRQFLQHDYYTDIITFDYSDTPTHPPISGDIFISLDTVRSNAEQLNQPYERELHRVIIHGILHLCGQNDKGPGEREQMEAAENKALGVRLSGGILLKTGLLGLCLYILGCGPSPRPAQMDIDSLFTDTTPTAAAVLVREDIYAPVDTIVADSLLHDSLRLDSIMRDSTNKDSIMTRIAL